MNIVAKHHSVSLFHKLLEYYYKLFNLYKLLFFVDKKMLKCIIKLKPKMEESIWEHLYQLMSYSLPI